MTTGAPNIVLVMSDQHRADMMGCAGDASCPDAVARRVGRRGRALLPGFVPGPALHAGAGVVHDRALRARPRRLHQLVRDRAGEPDLRLGPAGGRLPHLAPGQGAPLPRRAADGAAHGRHGRTARGAGLRRGLRDGRQVRREDPDPLHRLSRRPGPARRLQEAHRRPQLPGRERRRPERHQVRADVGLHTDAHPAGVLRRRLARPAGRAVDRALRPPGALLPLRGVPRAA